MELELSDGSILEVPDDTSDDQAVVLMRQAEDQLAPSGKGDRLSTDPAPVEEDKPGWDWLRNNYPEVFNRGHELAAGIGEGVAELPNIVPNVVNTGKSLYDLHFGTGTGEVKPEDQWQPWMDDPGKNFRELNPPAAPGLESWRDYGRATGTALPFGPVAAVTVPAISEGGGFVGALADRYIDPNEAAKWERTGEIVAPIVAGGGVRAGRALPLKTVGNAVEKVAAPIAGIATFLKTGDPLAAFGAGMVAPRALRVARQIAPYAAPLLDAAEGSLPGLLARSTAPAGRDNLNRGY